MSLPDLAAMSVGGHLPREGIGVALALAVLSTCCYATSAVLQEREAAGQDARGARMLARLVRRPWWWFAVAATGAGALLHISAPASGPLTLVQPLGVLTLVLALPLGARLGGRAVTSSQWRAAAAVALGLAALLSVAPHRAPAAQLPIVSVLTAAIAILGVVAVLLVLAARLPLRAAPVVQAAAAATCFGFASAMARTAVTGAGPLCFVAALALVDPLVAVGLGVTLLGEPLHLTPWRIVIGVAGLVSTAAGIRALTRAPHPAGPDGPATTTTPDRPSWRVVDEKGLAHVVR